MANLFLEGHELFGKDQFEAALEKFNAHLLTEKSDVKALYFRALTYRRLKQDENALIDLGLAVNLAPNDADLICERGISHFHLSNHNDALADLNKAQALEPNNPFRYSSRAFLLSNMNRVEDAINDYKKAIELDPDDAVSYNNLGLLEEKLGRMESAKRNYAKSDQLTKGEVNPDEKPDVDELIREHKKKEKAKKKRIEDAKQAIAPSTKTRLPKDKMTVGHFFQTLKALVTNKEERAAFLAFVRQLLGKK